MTLHFNEVEVHKKNTLVFPAFNLRIEAGETIAIHTTTDAIQTILQLLEGRATASRGTITLEGQKPSSTLPYKHNIGLSFIEEGIYERLSVIDNLRFFHQWYLSSRTIEEVMQRLHLTKISHKKGKKLTYSERRRIQVARVLLLNPSLFVFQELDQNVDIETKAIFIHLLEELKKEEKGVLVLASNLESAITLTDQVYRLDQYGLTTIDTKEEEEEAVEESNDSASVSTEIPFEKIPTKVDKKIILFHPEDIDFIESASGSVYLSVNKEQFQAVFTLSELEERLQPYGFFRCHRSFLVNLQKVVEVITWTRNSYSLKLDDGSEIPLSKSKLLTLKQLLGIT